MENFEEKSDLGKGKKTRLIIILACITLAILAFVVILTDNPEEQQGNGGNNNGNNISNSQKPNNGEENKEKEMSKDEAEEIFNTLPLLYKEEFAPFSDDFMLTAAMVLEAKEQQPDYSAEHIDSVVETIFGDGVKINKGNVSTVDLSRSLYYYYSEADVYSIIPVGFESKYATHLLNKATRHDEYVYVYTYEINGAWHQEEEEYVVVIGDKNGNDIVRRYNSYAEMIDYNSWYGDYEKILPIFKYTLKEYKGDYILEGLEKINY
ncbi:MAG: hypothetical protein IKV94_05965 [Clostridia bacterium]|nr:hypothetical protein [Clostridia bacterium]